jgi:hypothetical protein
MHRWIGFVASILAVPTLLAQAIPLADANTDYFLGGRFEQRMTAQSIDFGRATGGDLRNIEFVGTELVPITRLQPDMTQDSANASPFDNVDDGTFWRRITIPADPGGQPVSYRIELTGLAPGNQAGTTFGGRIYIGSGATPTSASILCQGFDSGSAVPCRATVQHPGGNQPADFWVMLWHRNGPASRGSMAFHVLPLRAARETATNRLDASGPSLVRDGTALRTIVQVTNPMQTSTENMRGAVLVIGGSPKRIIAVNERSTEVRIATESPFAYALKPSTDFAVAVQPGRETPGFFIDVPPNTARVRLTTRSSGNIDLHAHWAPYSTNTRETGIPEVFRLLSFGGFTSSTAPGGNETLEFNNPQPGRIGININSLDSQWVPLVIRAEVEANANVVRSGSYFNPDRPGHGLFVYPAGSSFAGLYYTYANNLNLGSQFDTPTWYYIQGDLPAADGIWRGTVFRSNWIGTGNRLSRVGEMVMTPRGSDAFQLTMSIDGRWFSQPYQALNRGCPLVSGVPRDASGHWFDPTRAGTGYSVQLFDNYEFYAFFGHDEFGSARYLVAELPARGAITESMPLVQVRGYPNSLTPSPLLRTTVGTLTRTFNGGTLSNVSVNGTLASPLAGSINQSDNVMPLGSTQGCDR